MSTPSRVSGEGPSSTRRSGERRRTGSTVSVTEAKKKEQKVDQILRKVYSKTVQVVLDARIGNGTGRDGAAGAGRGESSSAKTDKWFNLELEDYDYYREELKTWKGITALLFPPVPPTPLSTSRDATSPPSPSSSSGALSTHTVNFSAVPTLVFEVILDLAELPQHQSLVLLEPVSERKIRLDAIETAQHPPLLPSAASRRRNIVLERWTVVLAPPMPAPPGPELPTVYRHAIIHFRALYTHLRTLPAWQLQKRLKKGAGVGLKLGCMLSTGDDSSASDGSLIGVHETLAQDEAVGNTASFTFAPLQTPLGLVQTSVTYRANADFAVEETETMLSERFIDEDFFRPSLIRQPSAPATTTRPGSVPGRMAGKAAPSAPNRPSYGSVSSAHLPNPKASEGKGKEREVAPGPQQSTSPRSWTANVRTNELGEQYSVAVSGKTALVAGSTGNNGSALTAKLIGRKSALPPVTSNALPSSPPSGSRAFPGASAAGSPFSTAIHATHISSSPGSGPSSSIRISSGVPQRQVSSSGIPIVSSSPMSPSPNAPASYSSSSAVGGPSQSSTVAPRAMPMQQPMLRRYSSSRTGAPRSHGHSSSGGSVGAEPSFMGRRTSRLGLEGFTAGGSSSSPRTGAEVFGASYGRTSDASQISAEDSHQLNAFIDMVDSKPQLPSSAKKGSGTSPGGGSGMNRSQADEVLKRLASSVYETSVYGVSPEGSLPGSAAGMRPSSHRMTSLSGRPASALGGLREEEEPPSEYPIPTPPRHPYAPRTYSSSYQRPSPLSVSPGFGFTAPTMTNAGGSTSGEVPFPRYTSPRHSRRASADYTASAIGTTAQSGSATQGSTVSGQQPYGSSFDEGPVGKLELSLESDQAKQS